MEEGEDVKPEADEIIKMDIDRNYSKTLWLRQGTISDLLDHSNQSNLKQKKN